MLDLDSTWKVYPRISVDDEVMWLYMLELAVYCNLSITMAFDVKRKDFYAMAIHHVATIWLLLFSYLCNFVRVGFVVRVFYYYFLLIFPILVLLLLPLVTILVCHFEILPRFCSAMNCATCFCNLESCADTAGCSCGLILILVSLHSRGPSCDSTCYPLFQYTLPSTPGLNVRIPAFSASRYISTFDPVLNVVYLLLRSPHMPQLVVFQWLFGGVAYPSHLLVQYYYAHNLYETCARCGIGRRT